ncbi:MAG: hypothetical protein IKQ60_07830 [Candidatus Methanomethylophilaceae archaeon]|nr:hypothetical protein [Candidatus Methanomethylophilaceae archaeon]
MSERVRSMIPLAMSCFLLTGATGSATSSIIIRSWTSSISANMRLAPSRSPSMSFDMTMRLSSPSQSHAPSTHAEGETRRDS